MSRKRFTPEQIIGKLREAEAAFAIVLLVGSSLPGLAGWRLRKR